MVDLGTCQAGRSAEDCRHRKDNHRQDRHLILAALVTLTALTGCQTDQTAAVASRPAPPDARAAVLAARHILWKDPDSIKNASITAARRHDPGLIAGMWHVCVRLNAKNAFGGYTGERENLIGLYDDGTPPAILNGNAPQAYCDMPHEPFPELEGGYRPAKPKA